MSYKRTDKINELIKRELSSIFLRSIDLPPETVVTISQVKTSHDFSQTKIFLQVLPFTAKGKILTWLRKSQSEIRCLLARRLTTYRAPKIIFVIDESGEKAERLNQLLDNLAK